LIPAPDIQIVNSTRRQPQIRHLDLLSDSNPF